MDREVTPGVLHLPNISKQYPPPFQWIERSNIRRASGWIAGGQTTLRTLLSRNGYANRPHCIIPLGVDVNHFQRNREQGDAIRKSLGWDVEGPPVVGFLGRFIDEKGLRIVMQSLEACATPWRGLFVGGGGLEAELERWSKKFPKRIAIVKGVKHEDVPKYLNAMDVLLAPSQTLSRWREQLGRMLIEAFACGIPVIASDSGEIPFVIGDAGEIVAEKDVSEWTERIGSLLGQSRSKTRTVGGGHSTLSSVLFMVHCRETTLGIFQSDR